MKYCNNCNNGIDDSAEVCPICGEKQAVDAVPVQSMPDEKRKWWAQFRCRICNRYFKPCAVQHGCRAACRTSSGHFGKRVSLTKAETSPGG